MADDHDGRLGEIVTFYSYKGGTGRTMALANVAWILAANERRVLAVDWDLEAPGLHKFFRPFLDEKVVAETRGVHDLILTFALEATRRAREEAVPNHGEPWHEEYVQLDGHLVEIDWDFGRGTLDLMPAGQANTVFANAATSIDWNRFYEQLEGSAFFDALRTSLKRSYDYVLIDSRTGRSDIGDICTAHIPDTLVNCFTMSDQSIEGAAVAAMRISDRYSRPIRILPVPMRLDLDAEQERLDVGRATAQAKFDRFLDDLRGDELERYWRNVEVPYRAYYSYEEILAVFGDPANSPNTVLGSFERLAREITRGDVESLPPMREEIRQRHLQAFQRRKPVRPADLFLSYVPDDRPWADWLRELLTDAGFRVSSRPEGADTLSEALTATGRNVREAIRTVVVLSSAYLKSPEYAAVKEEIRTLDPVGHMQLIIPISVGGTAFTNPFPNRATADLDQLDEQQAREAVCRVVGIDVDALPDDDEDSSGLRFPGANPPVWNVPARNPTFTGRADVLELLRNELRRAGSAALLQVLHGLGGVGKTQIALEYAHRFRADYDIIWWIPSEEPNRVVQSVADLAHRLGVRAANVADAAAEAIERLRRGRPHKNALLIFDNAEAKDIEDLRRLIPVGGAAHVLITSRHRELTGLGSSAVDINVFSRAESIAHLQRHVPTLPNDDANGLADILGDLPIAVEMAAAWLKETGIPVPSYVQRLEEDPQALLGETSADYPQSVSAVWRATIEQVRQQSPPAVRLLELCAFFGPEPISLDLIYSDELIESLLEFEPMLAGERMMIGRIIRDLGRFALVRADVVDKSLTMHRLLQQLVQQDMERDRQEQMRTTVRGILAKMRPQDGDVDNPIHLERYRILWPHLYVARADTAQDPKTRPLMVDRVRYLATRGQIGEGLRLGQRMQRIWEKDSAADDIWLLALRCEIANIHRESGRSEEAHRIDSEVYELQIQNPRMGPKHLHTLRTAGSLAADLRALGRWNEALVQDSETYEMMATTYGVDHPRTLWAHNNYALSLRIAGRTYEARDMDQQVYDRRREILGLTHSLTLRSASNLARDLDHCGQYMEALVLLGGTVELCRENLGDDAPATLDAERQLAVAERRLGRYDGARRRAARLHERFLIVLGDDAIGSLASAVSLATHEASTGDVHGALNRVTAVLEQFDATLAKDHPLRLTCVNNRAVYLRQAGDSDAVALAREAHDGLITALGAEHPYTLASAMNLGNALADRGDHATARSVLEATQDAFRAVLDDNHPDRLACAANLAAVMCEGGARDEAEALRMKTLDAMAKTYDADHPVPMATKRWARIDRDLELLRI